MVNTWNAAIIGEELEKVKATTSAGIEANAEAIEALGYYSTDEVNTGKKLGDDDIYRKIFNIEALPNNETVSVPHGVTNLGQVVELRGIATGSSGGFPFDYRNICYLGFTDVNIGITSSSNFSTYKGLVIFEYTKTPPTP